MHIWQKTTRFCIKESYSAREIDRQINSGYYERYMLSKEKLLPEPIKGLKDNPFWIRMLLNFLIYQRISRSLICEKV